MKKQKIDLRTIEELVRHGRSPIFAAVEVALTRHREETPLLKKYFHQHPDQIPNPTGAGNNGSNGRPIKIHD